MRKKKDFFGNFKIKGDIKMKKLSIAIDGPAGAGKSSVSKILARRMGYTYLDTGAMYRALTYEALRLGLKETEDIIRMARSVRMTAKPGEAGMEIALDGRDVTPYIRTPEVSARVSAVSAIPEVREIMVDLQRKLSAEGGTVLDGRDIGTVVLPAADVKIFLTASPRTRAERRYKEMKEKNPGITVESIEEDIKRRDLLDSTRETSPLRAAEDAVLLDNSALTLEETAEAISEICREKTEARP